MTWPCQTCKESMQINLLQLFGQVLGAPVAPVPGMGFAEFLLAASPPGAPPPGIGEINEKGKEVSIKPIAWKNELDPDSEPNIESVPEQPGSESAAILGTSLLGIQPGHFVWAPHTWSITTHLPGGLPKDFPSLEALTSAGPRPILDSYFHIKNPNPAPNLPTLESLLNHGPNFAQGHSFDFDHPQSSEFAVAVPPIEMGQAASRTPMVSISGLTRQAQSGEQLEPVVLKDLGLIEVSGAVGDDSLLLPGIVPPKAGEALNAVDVVAATESRDKRMLPPLKSANPDIGSTDRLLKVERQLSEAIPVNSNTQARTNEDRHSAKPTEKAVSEKIELQRANPKAFDSKEIATLLQLQSSSDSTDLEREEQPNLEPPDSSVTGRDSIQALNSKPVTRSQDEAIVTKAADLRQAEHKQVLDQTLDRVERMTIHRPTSQMVIRLMPKELGEITLTFKSLGTRSDVKIEATDQRVVQALQTEQPRLFQAIEAKGISLESLSFQFSGEGRQNSTPMSNQRPMAPTQTQDGASTLSTQPSATNSEVLDLVI